MLIHSSVDTTSSYTLGRVHTGLGLKMFLRTLGSQFSHFIFSKLTLVKDNSNHSSRFVLESSLYRRKLAGRTCSYGMKFLIVAVSSYKLSQ